MFDFLLTRYARQSIGRLPVGPSRLAFWHCWWFSRYSCFPNALFTIFFIAPAHPHPTLVAVYPALFNFHLFNA